MTWLHIMRVISVPVTAASTFKKATLRVICKQLDLGGCWADRRVYKHDSKHT